jgi:thioredoxin 1
MIELNEVNFESETASGLTLVDFYTKSCGPCRAMAPILEQLSGAKIVKVDVENNMDLGIQYGVSSVPCLVFLREGKEVQRLVGYQSKDVLQNLINSMNG